MNNELLFIMEATSFFVLTLCVLVCLVVYLLTYTKDDDVWRRRPWDDDDL